jgi:hypothetical protein
MPECFPTSVTEETKKTLICLYSLYYFSTRSAASKTAAFFFIKVVYRKHSLHTAKNRNSACDIFRIKSNLL